MTYLKSLLARILAYFRVDMDDEDEVERWINEGKG